MTPLPPSDQGRRVPRLHVHDGQYVSIGFSDTNDTLLKIGGQQGPAGYKDIDRVRGWAIAMQRLIDREYGDA